MDDKQQLQIQQLTFKQFSFTVDTPDKVYTETYELEKTVAFIAGISLDSNREKLLYQRGTQKIEINRLEIFPEGFLSRKLYTLPSIEPHKRFYRRGGNIPTGNGIVRIDYKDTTDTLAPFEPYVITVTLDCILKDNV